MHSGGPEEEKIDTDETVKADGGTKGDVKNLMTEIEAERDANTLRDLVDENRDGSEKYS